MAFTTGLTIQRLGKIHPSNFVKFASTIGLNHIEFDSSVFNDFEDVKKELRAKQTVIHAPYLEDYGFDLSSNKTEADTFIHKLIRAKDDLNIIGVVVHPPIDAGGSLDKFYERIEKIPFPLLENMPYQSWTDFEEFFENTQANVSNNLGFCFDIPHSWITNGDRFLDLPKLCLDLLQKPSGYIHISGSTKNEDMHYPLLTNGDIPLKKVKQFLDEINFTGTITMELAPRSLEDIELILQSYMIMLSFAGKTKHRLKVRFKSPFIKRKINQLSEKVDSTTFKRP
ncbi:MAG: TIM barrel protein [Candidatus Hodarchaeota archaeon]